MLASRATRSTNQSFDDIHHFDSEYETVLKLGDHAHFQSFAQILFSGSKSYNHGPCELRIDGIIHHWAW